MNSNDIFEQIYESAIVLREAKTFTKASDIIEAIRDGTMIKLLNGKKNLPTWLKVAVDNNEHIPEITECFNIILGAISGNIDNGINETICLLIKKSPSLDVMKEIVKNSKDALVSYALSIKSQWIKNVDIVKEVEANPYDAHTWHEMEKQLIELKSIKSAKKHKTINDNTTLYDTLYEDGIWGLYIPKNQAGDSELASHIMPFEYDGRIHNKTRWCTAAGQNYYDSYSEDGNCFYVIKYFENGKYTEAWQIAFHTPTEVEIMDKYDCREYTFLLENAPDALLEKIVCDNTLHNNLTLKDFKDSGELDINKFFQVLNRDIWLQYLNTADHAPSLADFQKNYEVEYAIKNNLLADNLTQDDINHYGVSKCKIYTELLKKYKNIDPQKFTIDAYGSAPACPWNNYLSDINDGRISETIDIFDYWECGRDKAIEYSNLIKDDEFEASNTFDLRRYCNLSAEEQKFLNKVREYKKQGKFKGISYAFIMDNLVPGMSFEDNFNYFNAVAEGKCLPFPKHINGIQAYKACENKELLAQAAQDAKMGLIPKDILPTIYIEYNRKDVIDFYRLAQQGAFDDTATLKQFVEYGAENLNDINILKHQNRLWPTFNIEYCFQVGATRALSISRELFNIDCPRNVTLEDYFTYGIDIIKLYKQYKDEFPDAYFTSTLEQFEETIDKGDEVFNEFIAAIKKPDTEFFKDYSIDYYINMDGCPY